MSTKPKKSKGGRPTQYRDEFAEQAFQLCLLGATDDDLARFFGVSDTTIDNWKKAHPEFLASLKDGKEKADAKVAKSLYHRALGYEHKAVKILAYEGSSWEHEYIEKYPPDTTAAIFWLKNRRPDLWRDKRDLEHSGPGGGPLDVTVTRRVLKAGADD